MWPFYSSNDGIIVSKRAKRAADVATANAYVPAKHSLYVRATGVSILHILISLSSGTLLPYSAFNSDTLSSAASEIVRHIEKGEWTSSDVLEAYIARAAQAHEKTNCLTEGNYFPVVVLTMSPYRYICDTSVVRAGASGSQAPRRVICRNQKACRSLTRRTYERQGLL